MIGNHLAKRFRDQETLAQMALVNRGIIKNKWQLRNNQVEYLQSSFFFQCKLKLALVFTRRLQFQMT